MKTSEIKNLKIAIIGGGYGIGLSYARDMIKPPSPVGSLQ